MEERRAQSILGGGHKSIAKQHAKNKLTARERIAVLLDEGSFIESGAFVEHRCTDFAMQDKTIAGMRNSYPILLFNP